MPAESLLEYPCSFPVKALGLADDGFEILVATIVRRHAPDLGEGAVRSRPSRGGKYLAVTVRIRATSREQLDAIYQDLHAEPRVVMAL
jgi:putative lipoic acid-binding regulatory protein